jgi:drug/metabolite transporter (DMT)-like permease
MTPLALGLVILSAFFHATWNLFTKQSEDKLLFLWWMLLMGDLFFLPLLLLGPWPLAFPWEGWTAILASGMIHAGYYMFLGEAYERGDLSLVYPLARGSGPVIVLCLALLILGERPSFQGLLGIACVVFGVLALHLFPWRGLSIIRHRHLPQAALTGLAIGLYSTVDKIGVGYVSPLPYLFFLHLCAWLLLTPWILKTRGVRVLASGRRDLRLSSVAGGLQNLAYLLVLYAMTLAQVSYVVAARELNVLFGALLGAWWLREGYGRGKVVASVIIAAGVVLIGSSR